MLASYSTNEHKNVLILRIYGAIKISVKIFCQLNILPIGLLINRRNS